MAARAALLAMMIGLGACTAGSGLEGQRTVFSNPFVPPEIDRSGIGPQCDVDIGRDMTCLGGPVLYPGRGRVASLGHGETVRLTRAQRRFLRERAELLERLGDPPPAPAPAPPPAPEPPPAREGEAP